MMWTRAQTPSLRCIIHCRSFSHIYAIDPNDKNSNRGRSPEETGKGFSTSTFSEDRKKIIKSVRYRIAVASGVSVGAEQRAASDGKEITPAMLKERAEMLIAECNYDLAAKFLEKALAVGSEKDPSTMDTLAEIYAHQGNEARALQLLMDSTAAAPEANAEKWMMLAQLQGGLEAGQSLNRGIQLLEKRLQSGAEDAALPEQRALLSRGYCALAELYMTDLCFEANAEETCQTSLERAVSVTPQSVEVHQAMASFRLAQKKTAEAARMAARAFELIQEQSEDGEGRVSLEVRFETGKVLFETGQFEAAVTLIEDVITGTTPYLKCGTLRVHAEALGDMESASTYLGRAGAACNRR